MMNTLKVLLSIGTRPEVIKMAPIYHELDKRNVKPVLLHTGQHNEMATALYQLFDISPDYNLIQSTVEVIKETAVYNHKGCELSAQSSKLLHNISATMMDVDPDIVMVHGDTSSALMSAMAAFYQQRPIAHVEAGLRSHNEYDPFPEEMNRKLIARLARWHFAPTRGAENNLIKEGVDKSTIHVVGNSAIDAAHLGIKKLDILLKDKNVNLVNYELIHHLREHLLTKKMLMVTLHRRENHGQNIKSVAKALLNILKKNKDFIIVWPVHPNPKVKDAVFSFFEKVPEDIRLRLYLTEPLNYPLLLWIMQNAWLVLTDSGGIQEEAVALNTPIMVLRETTERPELIEAGAGMLIGTDCDTIVQHVDCLQQDEERYSAMCNAKNPFGDGKTAQSICDILIKENTLEKKYA